MLIHAWEKPNRRESSPWEIAGSTRISSIIASWVYRTFSISAIALSFPDELYRFSLKSASRFVQSAQMTGGG